MSMTKRQLEQTPGFNATPEELALQAQNLSFLCARLTERVERLERTAARLEVYVSTLRHRAGVTEVDELAEQYDPEDVIDVCRADTDEDRDIPF